MKPRILFLGDSVNSTTGFSRVLREIMMGIFKTDKYEIKNLAWGYKNEEHSFPFQLIPTLNSQDYFGCQMLSVLLESWKPNAVFTLGDVPWLMFMSKMHEYGKFIHFSYMPIDGSPLPNTWRDFINTIDVPIFYSKFGYDQVQKSLPNKKIYLIYHGVNIDEFKPLPKGQIESFKKEIGLEGKRIYSTIARNQWRKNLPQTFISMRDFLKDKDKDTIYYCHSQQIDCGWDLAELIDQFDLKGRVFIPQGMTGIGVDQETLNKIYNISEVIHSAPLGEGFGLCSIEAHAVGKPSLITNYSACPELSVSEHELIKTCCTYYPANSDKHGVAMGYKLADPVDYVNKLNNLYYNKELREEIGEKGMQDVQERFLWQDKIDAFIKLFDEYFN